MSSDISIRRISPSQIGAEYTNNKVGVVTGSSLSEYQKKDVWAQAYDNGSVGRVSSWAIGHRVSIRLVKIDRDSWH
jgi:hypothetical protein